MKHNGFDWSHLRASFWFLPALIVLASMAAALALIEVDDYASYDLAAFSPRLFGAGAAGSRAMLSAIATSMITVAGVVFSITIVTLSLTATQYSPRVLRNFMRDRPTQVVLGVFVGIFTYCLVVLRTIRGGDEGAFIPSLSVLGGMGYALAGVAVLIYFIHHIAVEIQASSILERIAHDTSRAIDVLYPQQVGEAPPQPQPGPLPVQWCEPVRAGRSGYVAAVHAARLLELAEQTGRVVRLRFAVGQFVGAGAALFDASGAAPLASEQAEALCDCVVLSRHRTVQQDAAFGLQQIVDVAVRALSPGMNDPTTATMCLDELGVLLAQLAQRKVPNALRFTDGQLRVIAPAPDFGELAADAMLPILRSSRGDLQVLASAATTLRVVWEVASPSRRAALQPCVVELGRALSHVRPRNRTTALRRQLRSLMQPLQTPDQLPLL